MQIHVRYFAAAREATGLDREQVEVEDGSDVASLLEALCARYPALVEPAASLRVALDESFAEAGDALRDGAEVALIPPVGGG